MSVFSTPTTTNRANPIVSNMKNVFSSFYQVLFENNDENKSYGRYGEVAAVYHPERSAFNKTSPERSAPYGCYKPTA